jgi:hypothetical protein
MRITRVNSESVAHWLLQCDHEDFNGPIDLIAKQYGDLYDVYTQWGQNKKRQEDSLKSELSKMTRLAQCLYEHLTNKAKTLLEERIAVAKREDEAR